MAGVYRVIHHGEQEFPVMFNFRSVGDAERIIGRDLPEVLQGTIGINTLAALFQAGLNEARRVHRLGGPRYTDFSTKAIMDEIGYLSLTVEIAEAVAEFLATGQNDEAEDLEEPEKN